jgi:O-acetyl-ADP-ribose deacetylase (regulator of RNase III)
LDGGEVVAFEIVRNDITRMRTDAVVNAANPALQMGGGVCGAIFAAAGAKVLQEECNRIGHCDVGGAVMTKGYALGAKYIIHAVGPIWSGGKADEARLLYGCYKNALDLALCGGCRSVALPLISSGIYGYPKEEALRIAFCAVGDFLQAHEMQVYLVIFDRETYLLSKEVYNAAGGFERSGRTKRL